MDAPFGPPLEALPEDFSSVLCVVAHPDDIEYGTSAAVARWTEAGKSVSYFLLTRGEAGIDGMDPVDAAPARADEERASAAVVGVDRVEFGDWSDGTIEDGLALRRTDATMTEPPRRRSDPGPRSPRGRSLGFRRRDGPGLRPEK